MSHVLTLASNTFADWVDAQVPRFAGVQHHRFVADCDKAKWGDAEYYAVCYAKHRLMVDLMQNDGDMVLYCDADVLLFADAMAIIDRAALHMAAKGVNIVGAHDMDSGFCTGFMVARACDETRSLCSFLWKSRTHPMNDQLLINAVARDRITTFTDDEVGNYANQVRVGVWQGEPFKPRRMPELAWHCNYVIGDEMKRRMRDMLLAPVSSF